MRFAMAFHEVLKQMTDIQTQIMTHVVNGNLVIYL